MKVGVWLKEHFPKEVGGGFSYYSRVIQLIDNWKFPEGIEIVFVSFGDHSAQTWKKPVCFLNPSHSQPDMGERIMYRIFKYVPGLRNIAMRIDGQIRKRMKQTYIDHLLNVEGVDIIFYPSQMTYEPMLTPFPFIATNWDLGHLSCRGFYELNNRNSFKRRQEFYNEVLKRAMLVTVESEAGKRELIDYLKINPQNIVTTPIFPGNVIHEKVSEERRVQLLHRLDIQQNEFLFYPAQFWPHKNHYNLLKAFHSVVITHPKLKLLFTGSDRGNLNYIKRIVRELNLENHVIFLGFVEDWEIYSLYRSALALVMPTFLGPTNIPPLEALYLDCPILCSDLEGHKEMLHDGALYFAPDSPEEISQAIRKILKPEERSQLLNRMQTQKLKTVHTEDHFIKSFETALKYIVPVRECWGTSKSDLHFT